MTLLKHANRPKDHTHDDDGRENPRQCRESYLNDPKDSEQAVGYRSNDPAKTLHTGSVLL